MWDGGGVALYRLREMGGLEMLGLGQERGCTGYV